MEPAGLTNCAFRPEGKSNECIYTSGIYTEESFQSMFNFPIISGDPSPLSNPNNLAISEKTGQRYYMEQKTR
jgi:hypothetical protein